MQHSDDIEAQDKAWLARRIREQWAELEHMRFALLQIRDCTSLKTRAGQWARNGLSWPVIAERCPKCGKPRIWGEKCRHCGAA